MPVEGKLLSNLKTFFRKELSGLQPEVGLFVLDSILVTCTHRYGYLRECEKNSLCIPVFRQGLKEHKGTQRENFFFLSARVSRKFFVIFCHQEFVVVHWRKRVNWFLKLSLPHPIVIGYLFTILVLFIAYQ